VAAAARGWCVLLACAACVFSAVATGGDAGNPFETTQTPTPMSEIDRLVWARLQRANIQPAKTCSDAVFIRRLHIDVLGTLPTAAEVEAFLDEKSGGKRRILIEQVLAREEFADYWAMKWSDLLRVKAEFPINLWPNAAQAYHRWIRTSIAQNKPYDRFVREILSASGSNFRVPQVNFFRAMQNKDPEGTARTVALTFMGARADRWPTEWLKGVAAFFSQIGYKSTAEWKEEIIYFDPQKPLAGKPAFPNGGAVNVEDGRDPREVFADWLISPRNPWFTACIANRVWCWLLGRGIVEEPDDLRADNPPRNPELLAYLQAELVRSNYDLKQLFRVVLNSRTYQLSSLPAGSRPEAEANFACYPTRRIEAEVLIDALNQITGTSDEYTSPIPEPFTFIPEGYRAIALADGSVTSPFLELFGRSSRDTGLMLEKNVRSTAAQRLHLLNSSHIQKKLEQGPKIQALLRSSDSAAKRITALYLTILSRPPTAGEVAAVEDYLKPVTSGNAGSPVDVAWALVNSAEFLHRH
jgi:hypothetical protein